ncbi:hypothetical protein ACIPLC_11255 [Kitasatospora sp. NPDC086801]|uniref:hypothetical protein n=1 Tax=Kitasatospora sp. NPDC086801 TaxID=3364066 RepID=UPI00383083A5
MKRSPVPGRSRTDPAPSSRGGRACSSITDVFTDNLRTIIFGLARETLSEQQAARTALELIIATPGTLQQGRDILRNLADNDPTLRIANTPDRPDHSHTHAALILAAAIIWAARHRR